MTYHSKLKDLLRDFMKQQPLLIAHCCGGDGCLLVLPCLTLCDP